MSTSSVERIAVIGLGYVGLPLAAEFGRHFATVGFDIDARRVAELANAVDRTHEVSSEALRAAAHLSFTADPAQLAACDVFIVAVPTPINEHKQPDFRPLIESSRLIGRYLRPGGLVIYESTVYPGATEEICVPELECASGLRFNHDFTVGYSPERINPGDQTRRLTSIVKVTAGSTPAAAERVDALYRRIITAGTHRAPSIKVAEAAKVIENTQRDVNIALMNEFAQIFHRLGIDTGDVLAAAGTKWNFLPFRPGLVGGHCIGVDPYCLIQKAQSVGYYPDILLASRRINDAMGKLVANEVVKLLVRRGRAVAGSHALVLGFTFKEDCPDLPNTRVVEVVKELRSFGMTVSVFDPWADVAQAHEEYGIELLSVLPDEAAYDAIVLAVAHRAFAGMGAVGVRRLLAPAGVVYDVKGLLPAEAVDARL